jgi:hypothetical protein
MPVPLLSADLEQLLVVRRQAGRYPYPNQALKRRLRRCRQAGGYAAIAVESPRRVRGSLLEKCPIRAAISPPSGRKAGYRPVRIS